MKRNKPESRRKHGKIATLKDIELKNVEVVRYRHPSTLLTDEEFAMHVKVMTSFPEGESCPVKTVMRALPYSFKGCVRDGRLIKLPYSFWRRAVIKLGVNIRYKQIFDHKSGEYLVRFFSKKAPKDMVKKCRKQRDVSMRKYRSKRKQPNETI